MDPECAARLMREKEREGEKGGTARSLVLVSTFTSDGDFIVESSGSSQVICGCGD